MILFLPHRLETRPRVKDDKQQNLQIEKKSKKNKIVWMREKIDAKIIRKAKVITIISVLLYAPNAIRPDIMYRNVVVKQLNDDVILY